LRLTFLGTRGEIEARTRLHRRHSSLLISTGGKRVMVDCGLDWLRAVHRVRPSVIVLTHAHPDHASGLRGGAPCPVWATEPCWQALARFPLLQCGVLEPGAPAIIAGVQFQAFEVEHSLLAPAVGYRFMAGSASAFYAPDLVSIHDRAEALRGVDLYIGDGATLHRPLVRRRGDRQIGHAPVSTQLSWCRDEGVPRAIITHCGSGIVTAKATTVEARVREIGRERGVTAQLAYDGLRIDLR
jgi:phosphoribosyl 1,2-cyclic phosphodiesterase